MALRGMEEIAEQIIGLGFSRLQTEELVTGRASYISECADIYGTVAIVTGQENSRGDRTETIVTRQERSRGDQNCNYRNKTGEFAGRSECRNNHKEAGNMIGD